MIFLGFGDVKLNNYVDEDGIDRCHGLLSPVHSSNGDIARVTDPLECIHQRIFLWKAIKKGEMPLSPNVGCCVRDYINEPLTATNLLNLKKDIAKDFANVFPEYKVEVKRVWSDTRNEVKIESQIGDFEVDLTCNSEELDRLHTILQIALEQLGMG